MQKYVTWMLVLTFVMSPAITIAGTQSNGTTKSEQKYELYNVELAKDGTLRGQAISGEGAAINNARIQIHSQSDLDQVDRVVTTDENGNFLVPGLKTGTCVITFNNDSYACRVWRNGVAPPKALQSIALVDSSSIVRGNSCGDCGSCAECTGKGGRFMNKLRCLTPGQKVGIGLVVAAAIVLPIVLNDDDDAS